MQVKLVRRWGPHRAGQTVQVSRSQGHWLVNHSYGTAAGVPSPEQVPAAEGGHGADPLAGGDASRRRPRAVRSVREKVDGPMRTAEGAPPAAYRGGYTAEDRAREGEAGKDVPAADEAPKPRRGGRRRKADDGAADAAPAAEQAAEQAGEQAGS